MIDTERQKLLTKRDKIEQQIRDLKAAPIGKSTAAAMGRIEDLQKLARKMVNIDKKLGRSVV